MNTHQSIYQNEHAREQEKARRMSTPQLKYELQLAIDGERKTRVLVYFLEMIKRTA